MKRRSRGFPAQAYRYIGGEFIVSFTVSFAFFFFVFFVNQLLLLAEDILQKDVPLHAVMRLIFYSLPSIIALSVPFATLVGTLMAVGRLSADNEIVALRASGFSLKRIFLPVLMLAFVLSGLSFVVNDILLPQGTLNFGRLYRELLYANPALELEPYSVKRYQDDTLITGAVSPGVLEHFVILDTDGQGHRRIITAREARLVREGDPNTIGLELRDVVTHSGESGLDHNYSTAEIMRYNILLEDITVALRSPGPREMSARDVYRAIEEKRADFQPRYETWRRDLALESARLGFIALEVARGTRSEASALETSRDVLRRVRQQPHDRSLQIYRLEYHKKYSIPFAALSFVFLAFPLGLFSKRSGRGVGFGIGLLIATTYWALLIGGQTFGSQRSDVSPALAMWLPNILFLLAGLIVFRKRMRQ
ncbi:MAG: YjgP/YjgQ family permease [Spirochaetaceae bacterium]|nr:MAG: YjgP/YjgQ family permease [Spirochaetaceae bacterium]